MSPQSHDVSDTDSLSVRVWTCMYIMTRGKVILHVESSNQFVRMNLDVLFIYVLESGFCYVAQAGFDLATLSLLDSELFKKPGINSLGSIERSVKLCSTGLSSRIIPCCAGENGWSQASGCTRICLPGRCSMKADFLECRLK